MSKEATIQSSVTLRINSSTGLVLQDYQSRPQTFTADVSMVGGPTPGEFLASKNGTQVVLTALVQPGLCRFQNLGVDVNGASLFGTVNDQYNWTNYEEMGVFIPFGTVIPPQGLFIPMLEALPGESYAFRLSRFLTSEFGGTEPGTGAEGGGVQLWVKSIGTASKALVEAFER